MRWKIKLQTVSEGEMLRTHGSLKGSGTMPAGAKNNLNEYLAIYSTVCVLWTAVRLTQQRTLMVGDKTVVALCLRMNDTARRNTNTGDVLLK
jgi:hypothetical protein